MGPIAKAVTAHGDHWRHKIQGPPCRAWNRHGALEGTRSTEFSDSCTFNLLASVYPARKTAIRDALTRHRS
jgi:hypothetical protein